MKLSVSVGAVFRGFDFLEGMKKTAQCGIGAYEFWAWWDKDVAAIRKAKDDLGLETAAFCTKFISLTNPARRKEYAQALKETVAVAKRLDCRAVISQVGDEIPGVPRGLQHESIVQGLKDCAPMLEDAGVVLTFEPLNTIVDHAGYYLWSSREAFEIAGEVGSPNVKVLYDIYHQQIMEGHLISRIASNIDKIGHSMPPATPGGTSLTAGKSTIPKCSGQSAQRRTAAM